MSDISNGGYGGFVPVFEIIRVIFLGTYITIMAFGDKCRGCYFVWITWGKIYL
jgi:hypothetical protein